MNNKNFFSRYSIQDWTFICFSILWVGIIILDYLNKQIIYATAISQFKYTALFVFLTVLGLLISMSYLKIKPFDKIPSIPINGLVVFVLFVVIIWSLTFSYNKYWGAPLDFTNYLHLLGKATYTLGGTFFMIAAAYSSGNLLRDRILKASPNLSIHLLDLALGFVCYTMILLLLGALSLLDQYVLLGVMFLMLLTNYKSAFAFVRMILWDPIQQPKGLKLWGAMIAFFVLVYIAMNYMYTQAPYPLGFDARNYYVNISKLIGEAGSLIAGYQPYAWGLVMSTGYIVFKSPEIAMFISALGGILSLFTFYELAKRYFNLSSNYAWLICLLFLVTPTVTNHLMIEFKIDLSLVFFETLVVIFLLYWAFEDSEARTKSFLWGDKRDRNAIIILGLLLGYCLSIKVLSVMLTAGIFLGIWWYHRDLIGVLGFMALILGVIFIAGFDQMSGLRNYHQYPTATGFALAILGFAAMGYSFVRKRQQFINSFKTIVLCGVTMTLTFSPWVYKNYSYKKSTAVMDLIMGEKPRPHLSPDVIEENYRKFIEDQE